MTNGARATWLEAAATWFAGGALAGFLFGAWILTRNLEGDVPWTAFAVLIGGPTAFLAFGGALVGTAIWLAGGAMPALRSASVHRALVAIVCACWVGYDLAREMDGERKYRFVGAFVALPIAFMIASALGRAARASALALGLLGLAGAGAFAAGVLAVSPPKSASAKAAAKVDPRDFVPTFAPVKEPPKREAGGGRVLLLGLDGMTWDKIDPLIAAGRLPNFAKLKRDGATTRLRTMEPTISPTIWTSMATGQTPRIHGIHDFILRRARFLPSVDLQLHSRWFRRVLADLDLFRVVTVTSNLRRCKAIWNVATEMGLSTCVVGWWASYPVEPINGWMISDVASTPWLQELMKPNESARESYDAVTHPPELFEELKALQRGADSVTREDLARFLPVTDAVWDEFTRTRIMTKQQPLGVFRGTYLRDEFFPEAALHIDAKQKPDLVLCYTRLTDELGHLFWKYSVPEAISDGQPLELVERYKGIVDAGYEWADRLLGRFFERVGANDLLIVVSDHGWEKEGPATYGHYHKPEGILAFYGRGARRGFTLPEKPHVLDVGPTLFHLLGIPVGEDMPGRFLAEAFENPAPVTKIKTWETSRRARLEGLEAADNADRMNELRGVGYIDEGK